ncbi:MAG: sulfite exporter TauE/SafE family protein [Sulfurimonas sp.]|nr:sulfite exporter TauE/SafE family protein [Sulfurimonas sp.]
MTELIFLGIGVGTVAGFFGIGGGGILIPILLFLGFGTKEAIGISIVQMVFSSIYGSYLNYKKGTLDIVMITTIGIGGFVGALMSGKVTANFSDKNLEIIFLSFMVFALLKMFFKTKENIVQKDINRTTLFVIGFVIGAISMTIGVGGALVLVPILVGFLHVKLKKAISAGLFFVVFSSISGLISHSLSCHIDFETGITIGIASLFGVYFGIILKDRVNVILQKRLLVGFYFLIIIYLIDRIFIHA